MDWLAGLNMRGRERGVEMKNDCKYYFKCVQIENITCDNCLKFERNNVAEYIISDEELIQQKRRETEKWDEWS